MFVRDLGVLLDWNHT